MQHVVRRTGGTWLLLLLLPLLSRAGTASNTVLSTTGARSKPPLTPHAATTAGSEPAVRAHTGSDAPAAVGRAGHPRAVVVLVPGITGESLLRELEAPRWARLRSRSGLALMNPAVPPPVSTGSATLSLGAGQRLRCPPDLLAVRGVPDPEQAVSPRAVCLPEFQAEMTAARRDALPGMLGEACARAGKRALYLGRLTEHPGIGDPGFLALVDRRGCARIWPPVRSPGSGPWSAAARAALRGAQPDLLVVGLAPGATPDFALDLAEALARDLDPARDLLLLTSPDPGSPAGGLWTALSPVLLWGGSWQGQLATSSTTRTRGLIANVDVASTLLEHLGAPAPLGVEGHPARPDAPGTARDLLPLARHAFATRAAMLPGLLLWGGIALVSVLWATAVLLGPRGRRALQVARVLLALTAAFPLAFLLAAMSLAASAADLLTRIVLLAATAAALAAAARRRSSPVLLVLAGLGLVILLDLFTGGTMLARNLMSDFLNIGARFYGIGNEYEGLLLGASVMTPFCFAQLRQERPEAAPLGPPFWAAWAAVGLAALVGVGAPAFGADFGGALSLLFAFLVAVARVWSLATGRKVRPQAIAAGLVLIAAAAAALVALDMARPAGARTHVGELAARALHDGGGAVLEIAGRKAMLNVRMACTVYFLGGLAAVTPVLYVWYHRLGREAGNVLAEHPLLRAGVLSALAGSLAALVLNDTGVIAGALGAGCGLFLWLDWILASRLIR